MTTVEVLEQLKRMSNPERLVLIETATRLIREDLQIEPVSPREQQDRRLRTAALAVKDLYEPGGELTEWTSLFDESAESLPSSLRHARTPSSKTVRSSLSPGSR
jgi:hypothetical protein